MPGKLKTESAKSSLYALTNASQIDKWLKKKKKKKKLVQMQKDACMPGSNAYRWQFNADKQNVIMTVMSLHVTRQLFVTNKSWGCFFLKGLKKKKNNSGDKSLCTINEREIERRQISVVNES